MTGSIDDLHELLLRLAGQVPDEVMTMAREQLARGDLGGLARTVTFGVLGRNAVLAAVDIALLVGVGADPTVLSDVDPGLDLPVEYGFVPSNGDSGVGSGDPDRAAVQLVGSTPGVRGLWRTWRMRLDGSPWPDPCRVYVVEVDADPVAFTATLQRRLAAAGEFHPRVEAYLTGTEVPSYLQFARAAGELLWARSPAPEIRTAVLFDEVDPELGPRFYPDHERIKDEAERDRLVGYLRRGEPLLVTTALLADVVDPYAGFAVPVDFRTDGTWLWTDATTYYLERHHLAPDPGLTAHIRARGYRHTDLDGVDIHRAFAALQEPAGDEPRWVFGP